MSKPIKPLRIVHNPVLARIIESGATNLPTGVTASGQLSILGANAAAGIRDNRDREKREIAELNNRLARYIEKVRFLEAQNRVLESDIGLFRQAAHIHSGKITVYYEAEKTSLVTLVREHDAKVSSAKQNIRKLEPEIATARKNWEMSLEHRQTVRSEKRSQMEKLSHIEAETAFVKRIINDCEEEKGHIKSEISRLRGEIKRVLAQRDKERSGFARSQSAAQDLLKKLNGTISQHEIAIREEINKARRDSTDKNRDYFHRELNLAMKEIRDQFESNTKKTRKTWDEWYKKKITDIKKTSERYTLTQTQAREEILRIRSFLNELRVKISDADTFNQQLAKRIEEMKYREEEDLRMFEHSLNEKQYATERMMDECAKLSVEVERLVENQITLRNEIAYYRKLMESAEHIRTTHQSNFVIDTPSPLMRTTSYHSHGSAFTLNVRDTQDKIVHHDNYDISNLSSINSQQFRSYSKGDVKIMEHKDESIVIENADNYKSKDLSNWKIHHYVDGALVGTFIFPIATHIHPRDKITVAQQFFNTLFIFIYRFTPYNRPTCSTILLPIKFTVSISPKTQKLFLLTMLMRKLDGMPMSRTATDDSITTLFNFTFPGRIQRTMFEHFSSGNTSFFFNLILTLCVTWHFLSPFFLRFVAKLFDKRFTLSASNLTNGIYA